MKKIFFLAAFALLAFTAQAQRELTTDSLGLLTNSGGVFFQTRFLKYDNGEAETITTRIGDTATVNNYLTNQAIEAANKFADAAIIVLGRGTLLNQIRDINASMVAATGSSTLRAMRAQYYTLLVDTVGVDKNYTWRNGTTTPVKVQFLANGNLRISGLPGLIAPDDTRNADFLGRGILRVNNFPTGSNTYLYRLKQGRWMTIDRAVELRLVGLNANSN